jgi:hypothetical protein
LKGIRNPPHEDLRSSLALARSWLCQGGQGELRLQQRHTLAIYALLLTLAGPPACGSATRVYAAS